MEDYNNTVSGETITFTSTGTDASMFTISNGGEITIESFEFKETSDGNFIEIIKRQAPNAHFTLAIWPPREPVDTVWKEIYGVSFKEDGTQELQLIKTIEATITPSHYVEESIEFEE